MLAAVALLILAPIQSRDPLAAGFVNPPNSAKPHTWWHWMNGNVTKEGITADLEAMKEVGIGGAQMFTVDQGIPAGKAGYMGQLWQDLTVHAVKEAQRLGIELCIHNCAGWSSSGGPWIKPEYAMQVLAWSESKVKGPAHISEILPQGMAPQLYGRVPYYKDIAVYAYPTPPNAKAPVKNNDFLGRTGVVRVDGLDPITKPVGPGVAVPASGMKDISSHMDSKGLLTWDAPAGDWTILRMGHMPTGKDNHPAPPEGDGLEVDKLSREALDQHWNGMMGKILADIGPGPRALNNSLIDSYEVGSQNWTPKFAAEFKKRRGYDPMPFLPAISGVVIDNKERTERFLWDMRRTIADLYADNYYTYFGELCHKNGLKFSTEPYGNGGFDNLQCGGTADIPMGEFWVGGGTLETTKIASSVGHIYDRPVIGAESFTADEGRGKWLEEPFTAKALGDLVFCNGVNRYIFHRYAMQPWMDFKPGMTMGPWGSHLERTQTWWTEARAWMKYIARCQYLLQSGKFVGDALYYYGENAPVDLPYRPNLNPAMPEGYDYDGCDATIVQRLTVKNGRLYLPQGTSYSVLVLPNNKFMTPAMARKVRDLVKAGATVVGPKPTQSPSLTGFPACDTEVKGIGNEVWGNAGNGPTTKTYGKGRVVDGKSLELVFKDLKVAPDFEYKAFDGGASLVYIHRRIGDAEVYFVSNQEYGNANVEATFRVSGKGVSLWHADSGRMESAPVYRTAGGRTSVPLHLAPAESVFVVFRGKEASHLTSFTRTEDKAAPPPHIPVIAVTKARYEAADGRGVDVTATVAKLVRQGKLKIAASNGLFGDPVVNVVKRLVVEFTIDGKPMKKTVAENETLVLGDGPAGAAAPAYDLSTNGFVAWKPGVYSGARAGGTGFKIAVKESPQSLALDTDWDVHFAPGWGAPDQIHMDKLTSWSESSDEGVKYFSGSAVYDKEIDVPSDWLTFNRFLWLDLGVVKNFATVTVNGSELAVVWKAPWGVDLTGKLKPGKNQIKVKITNLWPNRIIGDEHLPPDVEWDGNHLKKWPDWLLNGEPRPNTGRYTFTTWHYWSKDSPLLESGLIGPVKLISAPRVSLH